MGACKRVETIRCDGDSLTVVETKDHCLFIGGVFVGISTCDRLRIAPALAPAIQRGLEHYAHKRGWIVIV